MQDLEKKFETFYKTYQLISMLVKDLPIHPILTDKISHYFDTGMLWTKEALQTLQNVQEQDAASKEATSNNKETENKETQPDQNSDGAK